MFTPQKLWSLTPRSDRGQNNGSISGQVSGLNPNSRSPSDGGEMFSTGKALALIESDWPIDQDSSAKRVSKLENELFEYQYNMGLLLIEKKEWISKYEELSQALADTTETRRREEAMHLSTISELEKREENLKKALGVERQCVLDLEKALREMRSEQAEIKFNADSKLAEANLLVTSVEEKSLMVEAKFHEVDAKLAEASRKSSEIERKLHELESQENTLRRERSFFAAERKTHDTSISKQKEELREWERKLQEAEERLADSRRLMNQREERANENDKMLKEKHNELEELHKKVEMDNFDLRNKEEDISSRLAKLDLKEKEADILRKSLEAKERQLQELEKKLNTKEKVEIQKLLEEHEKLLTEKKQEFELEMDQRRKLQDEQLKVKEVEVEKREAEIDHMEEKLKKREQAIENKLERMKEKEVILDTKSKALRETEKSLKVEETSLETDKKQVLAEKEELLGLKVELENIRAETEQQKVRLHEEMEQLKVTEEERLVLERLQSELKKEIDKYRFQSEQLTKEMDDLKQEREKFEKEWEDLDDKRAQIKKEQDEVSEKKQYVEKLSRTEKERLQNEKLETKEYVQRELEALKLEKESFVANMEHEKSMLAENYQSEKSQLLRDFEVRKQELENEVQKSQEEMESRLSKREKSFEENRERELSNINYLREVARREMEEMKLERRGIEREKLDIMENKRHVDCQQLEMKKDIEELVGLNQKLKDQREQFIKERDRFVSFSENQKSCDICGEKIREFMLSELRPLSELNNVVAPPLSIAAKDYMKQVIKGNSVKSDDELSPVFNVGSSGGGTISWLRKCTTKIFKLSPGKKLEIDSAEQTEALVDEESPKTIPSGEKEPKQSLQGSNVSFDFQIIESDSDIPANSQNSKQIRQYGRQKGVRKPRVVRRLTTKAVIDGGDKTILGQSHEDDDNLYANGNAENYAQTNEESIADSMNRRKRNHVNVSQATASENQSEGHLDSIKDSDRPKRRRRVETADEEIVQKRYNLRRPKRYVATVADGSLPRGRKGKEKKNGQQLSLESNPSQNVDEASREEIKGSGAQATLAKDDPVRSTGAASAFSADSSPVTFKYGEETQSEQVYTDNALVDNMVVQSNEEEDDEDYKTESHSHDEDDDDSDDGDEVDHPGQASIGKKLWTFLTT